MTDWIFQANPRLFDVHAAVEKSLDDKWNVPRYRDLVAVGDRVWLQIVGPHDPGVYYRATITSLPYETPDSTFGAWHADLHWDYRVDPPLLRSELMQDPMLSEFRPVRGFQGTNVPVPEEMAARLEELTTSRLNPLGGTPSISPEADVSRAVERHNTTVRQQLKQEISKLSATDFELLVTRVLGAIGYEVEHTGQTNDGAVDALAVLSFGGLTSVVTKVQAKRWKTNVPPRVVRELRGALKVDERGLIVTTSEFTTEAKKEAAQEGKARIGLLGGEQLVRLCAEYGIGVGQRHISMLRLDLDGLSAGE